ncbi:MAG: WhiB family transcriptional regulator [Comamonadaceae bacterium]|nr:MAG: WhiB family transcriptional regulator [Comamonadaceae bacterium]
MASPTRTPRPPRRSSRCGTQLHARCRDMDTDISSPATARIAEAGLTENVPRSRSVTPCPIRRECRTHALTVGEPHGVWGGTTDIDRRYLTAPGPRTNRPRRQRLRITPRSQPPGNSTSSCSTPAQPD